MLAIAILPSLVACASYPGGGLTVGQSTLEQVLATMGPPAMQWEEVDGSRRLAYPRGPMGVHTYMADLAPDGRLVRIENAMDISTFAKVVVGTSADNVLRLLGPPVEEWTSYFPARDELVWGWRYCDDWNQLARFFVLFGASQRTVRSTLSLRESQAGYLGDEGGNHWCSR